ncbi:MAG: serine protease [Candidatus Parcubacteria bacterium]|nr:serine protease [Candidatus Parcubacteria bacterium]
MEDLTKQQMVLLNLLVSFVASTATSIVIVSMLTDTTPIISQTFNRIVEKTIERVVTGTTTPSVTRVPTPVSSLTENDQIVASVQNNLAFMVSISTPKTETNEGEKRGIGFLADGGNVVATDAGVLGEWNEFSVTLLGGKTYTGKKVFVDEKTGMALLELFDDKKLVTLRGAPLALTDPKLGQTVLSLGGKSAGTVSQGIVSEVVKSQDKENPITRIMNSISLSLSDRGGPMFGIDGKVIGINMVSSEGKDFSLSSSHIQSAINEYKKPKTDKPTASQAAAIEALPGV